MSDLPNPELESEFNLDDWKADRIKSHWRTTAGSLSQEWGFESGLFEDFRIVVEKDFGAKVYDDKIALSDPDLYRAGMKNVFDRKNESPVRDMVDNHYPVPFHEVAEETGQWLGRNYPNGWSADGDDLDPFVDEAFGMLALRETFPEFLDFYTDRIEQNLKLMIDLNDTETVDYVANNGTVEGYDVPEADNYTRLGEAPRSYADLLREAEEKLDESIGELERDTLEQLRKNKLRRDVDEWVDYLAACELVKEDRGILDLEDPESFTSLPSKEAYEALEYSFEKIQADISDRYDLP